MLLIKTILLLLALNISVTTEAQEKEDAKHFFRLGMEDYQQGYYLEALDNFGRAFSKMDVKHPSPEAEKCPYYMGCIAQIYNDDVYATRFYMLALDVCEKDSLDYRTAILSNLITVHGKNGTTEKANAYYKEYMKLKKRLNTPEDSCMMFSNQAYLELSAGNYEQALELLKAERKYVNSLRNVSQIEAGMETDFAFTYLMLEKVDSALLCLKHCEQLLEEKVHSPFLELRLCKMMSEVYDLMGNDDLTMQYLKRHYELEESAFNVKDYTTVMNRVVPMVESMYNGILLHRQRMRIVRLALTGGSIMLLLIAFAAYFFIRRRNRKKSTVAEAEKTAMVTPIEQEEVNLKEEHTDSEPTTEEETLEEETPNSSEIEVDQQEESESDETDEAEEAAEQRMSIAISDETYDLITQRIESILSQSEKICDPKFDLKRLVELTGSNSRYVSLIINQKYGKNFRMLLNERRVELACQKIDNVKQYGNKTIQSISEEVGYNSSTSFIEAFKKIKGITPYNYQKTAIRRSMEKRNDE